MKLRSKLTIALVTCGVLPMLLSVAITYRQSAGGLEQLNQTAVAALQHRAEEQLGTLTSSRRAQIGAYLDTIREHVLSMAEDPSIVDAMQSLGSAFGQIAAQNGGDAAKLQDARNDVDQFYRDTFRREYQRQMEGKDAGIDRILGRIDELQQTIAAAVEEQTAAIAEITRAANEAAMAAQDLDISVSTSADAARAAAAAVERSRTWLTRVGTALDQQRRAMSSISETVEMHPLRKAITAHAGWKTNLRKAIDTGRVPEGIDRSKAARSDACAFGQWLRQGEGDAADPRFAPKVSDLHARFHREAAAILETAVSGNQDRARVMLTDEHGYLATAGELTDNLLTWLAQVERS